MDPPLIHEASFSAANTSSCTLSKIWPFVETEGGGVNMVGGERDGSVEESTVTEQSVGDGGGKKTRRDLSFEDESSKIVSTTTTSTTCSGNELADTNNEQIKPSVSRDDNSSSKGDEETGSGGNNKVSGSNSKPSDPPKQDYIHVRARRGQATDSHSLAERARREKISERMKMLQDLVPGCNKVTGKALLLDEIINYVQSLQRQVEADTNNKQIKPSVSRDDNSSSKGDEETSSAGNNKVSGSNSNPSDPPKQDYIHVRARRGQATDSHSLAERARREKISERMKILQDLVPGCNKVIGKALVLDEIINYIQSLQHQVEFLSMKLETVNSRTNLSPTTEGFHPKDVRFHPRL